MVFKYQLKKEWPFILLYLVFIYVLFYFHLYGGIGASVILIFSRWKLNLQYEIKNSIVTIGTYSKTIKTELADIDKVLLYEEKWLKKIGITQKTYGIVINKTIHLLNKNIYNQKGQTLADMLIKDYELPIEKRSCHFGLIKVKVD